MSNQPFSQPVRSAADIARRALALHCIVARSHGVDANDLNEWLVQESLADELTERESRFFSDVEASDSEVSWMSWMVEAQAILLLLLGRVDFDSLEGTPCPVGDVIAAMPDLMASTKSFIDTAKCWDFSKIEHLEQQIYDSRVQIKDNSQPSEKLPPKSIYFYRHYALAWILDENRPGWDDVTPDI